MASIAQITANQHNASLSIGPKTPEGKAAAARNATRHGLSGAFTVLPHEDQEEFDISSPAFAMSSSPPASTKHFS
jgi:hypothetical protein